MHRANRPPSRVSKACDRCKTHKKRCDFDRPCQHCLHAKSECSTSTKQSAKYRPSSILDQKTERDLRKPRQRRQVVEQRTQTLNDWPPTGSRPSVREVHAYSASGILNAQSQPYVEAGSSEVSRNTPHTSHSSENQSSAQPQQNERGESSAIPNFEADSALAVTQKILRSQNTPSFRHRTTFAIPGGRRREPNGTSSANHVPTPLVPIIDVLGIDLPSHDICNQILETYFSTVHWFSLVVYEPKFRLRYDAILGSGLSSRSDHGFLLLVLMLLIMGCWYTPRDSSTVFGMSSNDLDDLRGQLLKTVERNFMELMDEECLEFIQISLLLGSFYLYHGRPRSSFSILGAATRTAQAMDLHRDSERFSSEDKEERKRVWWTIYTWDRFATLTYGRPFGINDKDCNVSMPSEVLENVHFIQSSKSTLICLSDYQTHLNIVYRIASPLLGDIYSLPTSVQTDLTSQLPSMVMTANRELLLWKRSLPHHLVFDNLSDINDTSTTEEKMHSLQALSLKLTYENIMILAHRPLLAARGHGEDGLMGEMISSPANISTEFRDVGFERCLSSALEISNVQRLQNLFDLARTTHLVSFIGMNLFTASVVLFICALRDTLSDTAQEAKRGLKRTLKMQKALSNYASLSMQCTAILEDLIQLILRKEMDEMLHDDLVIGGQSLNRQSNDQYHQTNGVVDSITDDNLHPNPETYSSMVHNNDGGLPSIEGTQFNRSLRTLQQVFYDSNVLRYQAFQDPENGLRPNYGNFTPNNETFGSDQTIPLSQQNASLQENAFTGVEDLGQFWLWNLDNLDY